MFQKTRASGTLAALLGALVLHMVVSLCSVRFLRCKKSRLANPTIRMGLLEDAANAKAAGILRQTDVWKAYQAYVKHEVTKIGDRLDESLINSTTVERPVEERETVTRIAPIDYAALQQEIRVLSGDQKKLQGKSRLKMGVDDLDMVQCRALVTQLERYHFAILRLSPSSPEAEGVRVLWSSSKAFYDLPDAERLACAGPVRSEVANDASLVVGYFNARDGNQFLETRLSADETFHPQLCGTESRTSAGGADGEAYDLASGLLAGRKALTGVGQDAIVALALAMQREYLVEKQNQDRDMMAKEDAWHASNAELLSAAYWLRLLDDGTHVAPGSLSASVHRICHYTAAEDELTSVGASSLLNSTTSGDTKKVSRRIAFGAHTDATFFTVIPVAATAGLQVFAPGIGWLSPEGSCDLKDSPLNSYTCGEHEKDVVLLPGEFIQVLSGGRFQCAVHRVARPEPSQPATSGKTTSGAQRRSRLSAPLLLRGRAGEVLAPSPNEIALGGFAVEANHPDPRQHMSIPPGTTVTDLHRLLLELFSEDNERRDQSQIYREQGAKEETRDSQLSTGKW